jgi:hypothetical protein
MTKNEDKDFSIKGVLNMRNFFVCILIFWVFVSMAYSEIIYKWVDKDGVVNFTDDPTNIPSQYRNRVERGEKGDSQEAETPAHGSVSPEKGEGGRVDLYGMGEDYWRAKVQPWKNQLKEAKENCERTNRKIDDTIMEQGGKMLSPTQYDMKRAEVAQLKDERSKCEAQIREANEMLNKIAKEAEGAGADPEWVK